MDQDAPANSPQPQAPQPSAPGSPKPSNSFAIYTKGLLVLSGALVLLLVFAVIYHQFHKTTTINKNTTSTTADVIVANVDITSSGFSPATLQVTKNTTVHFSNNDTKPHWVASDPYPTDSNLADFNSKLAIQPNQGFDYTFTTAGTFSYHDDLNPYTYTGSIIVK